MAITPNPALGAAADLGLGAGLVDQTQDEIEARRKQMALQKKTDPPTRDPVTGLSPAVSALLGM